MFRLVLSLRQKALIIRDWRGYSMSLRGFWVLIVVFKVK
jgi:hypothetical protein